MTTSIHLHEALRAAGGAVKARHSIIKGWENVKENLCLNGPLNGTRLNAHRCLTERAMVTALGGQRRPSRKDSHACRGGEQRGKTQIGPKGGICTPVARENRWARDEQWEAVKWESARMLRGKTGCAWDMNTEAQPPRNGTLPGGQRRRDMIQCRYQKGRG